MNIIRQTHLNLDSSGREKLGQSIHTSPVSIYIDELHKYDNGRIGWHWHPQAEVILAESQLDISVGDRQYRLEAGEGIMINSGQLHMFALPEGTDETISYAVIFMPEFLAHPESLIFEKYIRSVIENQHISSMIISREILKKLKDTIKKCEDNEFGCELELQTVLSHIWLQFVKSNPESGYESGKIQKKNHERLKAMISYIHANYGKGLKIEDIAGSAYISKSECLRCFKNHFSTTPMQYVTEYRMEIAADMLVSTELSVQEIAGHCGYSDPGYFGKVFLKEKNMTPGQFRKIYQI